MRPSKPAGFALRALADHKERTVRPKCGFWSLDVDYKSHSPRPNTQQKKTCICSPVLHIGLSGDPQTWQQKFSLEKDIQHICHVTVCTNNFSNAIYGIQ